MDINQFSHVDPEEVQYDVEDSGELNADISERFSDPKSHFSQQPTSSYNPQYKLEWAPSLMRKYFNAKNCKSHESPWLKSTEIPMSAEILDTTGDIHIPTNLINGEWSSKEEYLKSHYELLREDAVRPLREAVAHVRAKPCAGEDDFQGSVGIYENVHFSTIIFSKRGLAVRAFFSLARVGKRIQWDQSKRLLTGSLIALTPLNDMFQTKCILATIAARPLSGLNQNPPEVDIFFARPDEIEINPSEPWVMVEDRTGFYEAHRHTMLALQRMINEPFPLSEHLVKVKSNISPPEYIRSNPSINLSSIVPNASMNRYQDVNILQDLPESATTDIGLDKSQLSAFQRIMSKSLAIVQGPPGTGKTYVSVVALKALLANIGYGDPPIIIACQTNHALDQILRHVAEFEENFIRVGGRTKDLDVVKKRTLYELRQTSSSSKQVVPGGLKAPASRRLRELTKTLKSLLSPLTGATNDIASENAPLDHITLQKLKLLTEEQCDSLEVGASDWVRHKKDERQYTPIELWMGKSLIPWKANRRPDDFGLEYEEADLELERLKEIEAENVTHEDDECEILRGEKVLLSDKYTGKNSPGVTEEMIQIELRKPDLNKIPQKFRGPIYCYLQKRMRQEITEVFRKEASRYEIAVRERRIGLWEEDMLLLQEQKVIGMTTTGLSKYRAMLWGVQPKTILIEEAAETLEAPIISACVPTLEHLILVGDHQQLRPHCQVQEHEGDPYNLSISLFERLVMNGLEYNMLKRQRRMIPEIRRVLKPIYGNEISDHPHVKDPELRPPVPGMGGCNSYFFTHHWPETRDHNMSSRNQKEAEMVVGFFDYLVLNGVNFQDITVLTFYNGQRREIIRRLQQHKRLEGNPFKVFTVDSYQGEENEIVLLSLVRNNEEGKIGFLNVVNRVCVAISRARCGFYIFGNAEILCAESSTWVGVIETMIGKRGSLPKTGPRRRLGYFLPLTCTKHGHISFLERPEEWENIQGGCIRKCRDILPCGHTCPFHCHPFVHDWIKCPERCSVILQCGHPCVVPCCEECRCGFCTRKKTGPILNQSQTQAMTANVTKKAISYLQQNSKYIQPKGNSPVQKNQQGKKYKSTVSP